MKVVVFVTFVSFVVEGAISNWVPVAVSDPSQSWNTNSIPIDQNRKSWNGEDNFRQKRNYDPKNNYMNYWGTGNGNNWENQNKNENYWYDQQRRSFNDNESHKWSEKEENQWLNWYNSDKNVGNNGQNWNNLQQNWNEGNRFGNDNSLGDKNWNNGYEKWYDWFKYKYQNNNWNDSEYKNKFEKWYDSFKNNQKPNDSWNNKYKTEYEKWYDWFKANQNDNWNQNKFKTEYEKWYDWFQKNHNQYDSWNNNNIDGKPIYAPWYDQSLPYAKPWYDQNLPSAKPWYSNSNWNNDAYVNSRTKRSWQDTPDISSTNNFPANAQPSTLNDFLYGLNTNRRSDNPQMQDSVKWSQPDPMYHQEKEWQQVAKDFYGDPQQWNKNIPTEKKQDASRSGNYFIPANYDIKNLQKTDQLSFGTNMREPKWATNANANLPPWLAYPISNLEGNLNTAPSKLNINLGSPRPGATSLFKPNGEPFKSGANKVGVKNVIALNTSKVDTTKKNVEITSKPITVASNKIVASTNKKIPTVIPLEGNVAKPNVLTTKPVEKPTPTGSAPQTIIL